MSIYIGVNGKARKVVGGYVGNSSGKAVPIYTSDFLPTGYYPTLYTACNNSSNSPVNIGITPTILTRVIVIASVAATTYQYGKTYYIVQANDYKCHVVKNSNSSSSRPGEYIPYGYFANNGGSDSMSMTPDNDYSSYNGTRAIFDINKSASKDSYIKFVGGQKRAFFTSSASSLSSSEIQLFGNSNNTDGVKIYYCKIFQNILTDKTPTAELYPCMTSTGEAGFYDAVRKKYYTNANGHLSYGPNQPYNIPNLD